MNEVIQEYAKRLKLSWVREHYHEVEAATQEEFFSLAKYKRVTIH